ncbi:putative chromatin organization modifier protein [Ordospora pajunii]|uniref:putative chromatin organization modifier protein n=1 Tax=Ordospora pajunii TaxID=3039483 RepID=UPI0029526E93|nr:putative chromatin organization modifier protein [Ordospora pajunii]KAH9411840.1 putative chromatin organization modifier protein [Ordospora pajunii]
MSGDDVYVVEKVVASRKVKGVKQYLLKWMGYPDADNTWEDEENIFCKDMIQEYESKKATANANAKQSKKGNVHSSEASTTQKAQKRATEQVSCKTSKRSKPQKGKNGSQNSSEKTQEESKRKPRAKFQGTPDAQVISNSQNSAVEKVISVERSDSKNGLTVYLLFKNGENGRFPAEVVHKRYPIPLLEYYESNLVFCEDGADASN